ncbi:uncharacterized protein LOC123292837 [Chrysoperla carnea]|uniref:uncharacterized protein LOC123292837 n=1 Tax=Chrysoperla carnea TaxID=189513 RepID=UPI001D06928D|nr:uncharacterized protein LOC123292837 [Chrysoperla carnea]
MFPKFIISLLFTFCYYGFIVNAVGILPTNIEQNQRNIKETTDGTTIVTQASQEHHVVIKPQQTKRPLLISLIWRAICLIPTIILSRIGLVSESRVAELASVFISFGKDKVAV